MVILAAGTTAPEGSLTAPEIDAETCAYIENVQKSTEQRSFMSCKESSVIHKRQRQQRRNKSAEKIAIAGRKPERIKVEGEGVGRRGGEMS